MIRAKTKNILNNDDKKEKNGSLSSLADLSNEEKEEKKEDGCIKTDLLSKKIGKDSSASYNLDDIEIKKITLDKNIVIRVISNVNGTFVDIRKYYKGYPTKKGIRITLYMFKKILEILKDEII